MPPQEVHLGVIHEAHPLQVRVTRPLGDVVALSEVVVRAVVLPQVRGRDAEVGVGNRAPMLVVRCPVRLKGALVVREGLR